MVMITLLGIYYLVKIIDQYTLAKEIDLFNEISYLDIL